MLMVYHQKCPYEIGYKKFVPFPDTQMLKNWNGMWIDNWMLNPKLGDVSVGPWRPREKPWEGTIYGDKVFPWARDCLMELKSAGVQIVLLNYRMELEEGLQLGVHYDSIVEVAEDTEELENLGNLVSGPKERILVVGDSVSLMRAASRAGMPSAFICSGRMSQEFQMSPAPAIDVPANGGHFSEPENLDCWDAIFRDCPLPDYGLACFAFSDTWWIH